MFSFTFGDIGSGKSLRQADTVLWLIRRSKKIEKSYKLPTREVWCNFHMAKSIMERNKDRLHYWRYPQEMIFSDYPDNKIIRRNFDCVWDEMAVELPSDRWKDTDPSIRRFFAQHRKRGVQIWGNTQDYMMLDINARRMATHVYETIKLCGSRDPSPTLPPIRLIWGIIMIWQIDKRSIREDGQKKIHVNMFPELMFITKQLTDVYDTGEDIDKSAKTKLQHIELICDKCGKIKVEHSPI